MSGFKVGDLVKSGGAKMTVVGLPKGADGAVSVNCAWHDKDSKDHTANYPAEALKSAAPSPKIPSTLSTPTGRRGGGEGTGWMGR